MKRLLSKRKWMVSLQAMVLVLGLGWLWTPQTDAAIYGYPGNVTLFEDTPFYDDYEHPDQPAGIISAIQSVKVTGVDQKWYSEGVRNGGWPQWFRIETWLGHKWIRANSAAMVNGAYREESKTITTVDPVRIYDSPRWGNESDVTLSPQKLNVTARIDYCNTGGIGPNAFACSGVWYRVDTWLGDRWIPGMFYLEMVREQPVDLELTLISEESLYDLPYISNQNPAAKEKMDAGTVHVVAQWGSWYKVESKNGLKWLLPKNMALQNVIRQEQSLDVPTGARGFASPSYAWDGGTVLPSGTYTAFEQWGEWYHVRSELGDLWIWPKQALVERPAGIEPTEEEIELTPQTGTYRYPDHRYPAHLKGFYSQQKVKAFEKWTSPIGEVWYHIHGFGIDEWVPGPDSPFMKPKTFRELYPGDLAKVTEVQVYSSAADTPVLTLTGPDRLSSWLRQVGELPFTPYELQTTRVGYKYRFIMIEGDGKKFEFTTWNINGIDYEPVPDFIREIDSLIQPQT